MRGLASFLIFYIETSKTALLCTRQQGADRFFQFCKAALNSPTC